MRSSFAVPKARRLRPVKATGEVGSRKRWRRSINLSYADWLPHERVSSRACLGLSAGVGMNQPEGALEDCPDLHPAPGRTGSGGIDHGAVDATSRPIAQTKPESSRAIAATTTVGFLPAAPSLR